LGYAIAKATPKTNISAIPPARPSPVIQRKIRHSQWRCVGMADSGDAGVGGTGLDAMQSFNQGSHYKNRMLCWSVRLFVLFWQRIRTCGAWDSLGTQYTY